jgi:hypothetical protein
MGLRSAAIERMIATVDATEEHRVVKVALCVEIRSRTGRVWEYSDGPAVIPLEQQPQDLKQQLDFFVRDRFEELLDDVQRDGYDGPRPSPGVEIEWLIADAAQRSCS